MNAKTFDFTSIICLRGHWWLPEYPDKQVSGTLEFDQNDKANLVLDGVLSENEDEHNKLNRYPIVYGKTTSGTYCTLCKTLECSRSQSSIGLPSSTLVIVKLFIGHRTFNPDKELVESVAVEFSNFKYWMNRDSIKEVCTRKHKKIPEGIISYKLPKDISFWVESINAHIRFEGSINTSRQYQKITISKEERIRIVPKTKKDLSWYEEVISMLRILFGILSGNPTNIKSLTINPNREKTIIPGLGVRMVREEFAFVYRQMSNPQRQEATLPNDIPFSFPVIGKNSFSKVLNLWFDKSKSIGTASSLHFGTSINSQLPAEYCFLTMIQAVESYSRSKGDGKYLSKDAYEPIRSTIVKAIPNTVAQSHHDALKSRIQYGYEYSLRKRFDIIINSLPEGIRKMVTGDDAEFVSKLKDTRNYLTHRDDSISVNILDSKGRFNYAEKLKLLLEYFLLVECGLNIDLIVKVMTTHRKFTDRPKFK